MEVHVDRIVTGKVLSVDHELLVFTLDDFKHCEQLEVSYDLLVVKETLLIT